MFFFLFIICFWSALTACFHFSDSRQTGRGQICGKGTLIGNLTWDHHDKDHSLCIPTAPDGASLPCFLVYLFCLAKIWSLGKQIQYGSPGVPLSTDILQLISRDPKLFPGPTGCKLPPVSFRSSLGSPPLPGGWCLKYLQRRGGHEES